MCACKHWLAELYKDLLLMALLARDLGVRSFLLELTGSNVLQQFIIKSSTNNSTTQVGTLCPVEFY